MNAKLRVLDCGPSNNFSSYLYAPSTLGRVHGGRGTGDGTLAPAHIALSVRWPFVVRVGAEGGNNVLAPASSPVVLVYNGAASNYGLLTVKLRRSCKKADVPVHLTMNGITVQRTGRQQRTGVRAACDQFK